MSDDLDIEVVEQKYPRLGRQKVHDPKSRAFPVGIDIDRSTWRDKRVRLIDPRVNPRQCHGECTGCAKTMEFNAIRNRIKGQVLKMDTAHEIYSLATKIDPWAGSWPPDDTGSSGLAAAKAAQRLGLGGEYRHVFRGADEVVQLIQTGGPDGKGRVVNCGTWWFMDMFAANAEGIIEPTGSRVGGHMYIARGYEVERDLVLIRCWWGIYRDVWIRREHLNDLLMDGGDAHIQDRLFV